MVLPLSLFLPFPAPSHLQPSSLHPFPPPSCPIHLSSTSAVMPTGRWLHPAGAHPLHQALHWGLALAGLCKLWHWYQECLWSQCTPGTFVTVCTFALPAQGWLGLCCQTLEKWLQKVRETFQGDFYVAQGDGEGEIGGTFMKGTAFCSDRRLFGSKPMLSALDFWIRGQKQGIHVIS